MGILETVLAAIVGVLGLLGLGFAGGKKIADGKHAKQAAEDLREVIEDAKTAADIRADDSDDPFDRLRKQSGSGS